MLPIDFIKDLKESLQALVWPTTTNKVFSLVKIVPYLRPEQAADHPGNAAFIIAGKETHYEEHDELVNQDFTIAFFVKNNNDRYNEGAIVGSNITADTSQGVGILQLDTLLINHMRGITSLTSKISFKGADAPQVAKAKGNNHAVYRQRKFSVTLSHDSDESTDFHNEILRMPGRLYWNPVDLAENDFGSFLGYVKDGILFFPQYEFEPIYEETRGREPVDWVYMGFNPKVVADIYNFNSISIARYFPGMTSGSQVQAPNNQNSGNVASLDSNIFGTLLYLPNDTANNKVFLLKKCVPFLDNPMIMSRKTDTVFRTVFQGVRKSTVQQTSFYFGPIENATLN